MHVPVLQKEIVEYLKPKPNENFIDCTIGEGGHALAILKKTAPDGKILGIDWDGKQIENCKRNLKPFENRLILVCDSYFRLKEIVARTNFRKISGILFDLGMSSWHLEDSGRGFTFKKNELLDMRYNQNSSLNAKHILNHWPREEIERILKIYGEEKFAKKIAKEIAIKRRKKEIETTFRLVEIIRNVTPQWYRRQKIHFATRTFQAIRIAVNDEIENLKKALPQALEVLERKGRLAIISFHSLEDGVVKNFFKSKEKEGGLKILTKKPVSPTLSEVKYNRRSRSAKLRVAQKN